MFKRGWIGTWLIVLVVIVFVVGVLVRSSADAVYEHVGITDGQGLCWLSKRAKIEPGRVTIYTVKGQVVFHNPALVVSHDGSLPKDDLADTLKIDLKFCTHIGPTKHVAF